MKKKLVQTNFDYVVSYIWQGSEGFAKKQKGSYLGRKQASVGTIRRFLMKNAEKTNCDISIKEIAVTGSYVSSYLHA